MIHPLAVYVLEQYNALQLTHDGRAEHLLLGLVDLVRLIGQDVGELVGGQVVDVESEKKNETVERERLDFIYRLKTGALLEASLMIGAILAGADEAQVKKMEEAGTKLGLAFQIQDDILDVTSTVEVLGKPIGSDEKNQKATYVSFEGMDKAKQDVALFSEEAVAILEECSGEHAFLRELFLYLIHREK